MQGLLWRLDLQLPGLAPFPTVGMRKLVNNIWGNSSRWVLHIQGVQLLLRQAGKVCQQKKKAVLLNPCWQEAQVSGWRRKCSSKHSAGWRWERPLCRNCEENKSVFSKSWESDSISKKGGGEPPNDPTLSCPWSYKEVIKILRMRMSLKGLNTLREHTVQCSWGAYN